VASKQLSERAKRRLRIAAGFLRGQGTRINCPREEFYDYIQTLLGALHHERHATLKALVDWVEDYDLAGDARAATHAQKQVDTKKPK
jgi:hypothetical protein